MVRKREKVLLILAVFTIIFITGVSAESTICGNSIVEEGEWCDDGNNVNGDGCSALCILEFCGDMICNNYETVFNCPCDCGNCPIIKFCGDEICDAGEGENCATCPEDCGECPEPEDNNYCYSCPVGECDLNENCGNGIIDEGEECDDGNSNNFDGCSKVCFIEEEKEDYVKNNRIQNYCEPNWECSGWSGCVDGTTTRKCFDENRCSYSYNKPIETNSCYNELLSPNYTYEGTDADTLRKLFIITEIIILIVLLIILIKLLI